MRKDFVHLVGVVFRNCEEKQKDFFLKAPFYFGDLIKRLLIDRTNETTLICLRILGDMIIESDAFCTHIVCTNGDIMHTFK